LATEGRGKSYIGNAVDTRTFELTTVKLLHGGPQVCSRLKLNEAVPQVSRITPKPS
jgi:hypothetical protein